MGDKGQKGSVGRHGKIGPIGSKGMLSSIIFPLVFPDENSVIIYVREKFKGLKKCSPSPQSLP